MYWSTEICGIYADNGEKFCISRVRYGDFRWGEGKAAALADVAKYPVGRSVNVYYAPDNPRATLLEAISPWTPLLTLLGLGVAGLLLPLILWLFRHRIDPARYPRR